MRAKKVTGQTTAAWLNFQSSVVYWKFECDQLRDTSDEIHANIIVEELMLAVKKSKIEQIECVLPGFSWKLMW